VQRWLGIAVIVGLIWLGATLFSGGSGAVFGRFAAGGAGARQATPLERIRASGEHARELQERRLERQLEPAAPAERE
jgi:hypothetical protein